MNVLLCWLTQFLETMRNRKDPQTKNLMETYPKALNYTVEHHKHILINLIYSERFAKDWNIVDFNMSLPINVLGKMF